MENYNLLNNEELISLYHKTINEEARNRNLQMAKKIELNAFYGAQANPYFRWFSPQIAESVTKSGQLSIRWIENKLNEQLNKLLKTNKKDYIVGADTDSVYICLDDLVKKACINKTNEEIVIWIDKACKEAFEPFIDKAYEELAIYTNAFAQKMKMKREVIADKGIWTAKKHYLLNVYNSEGVQYKEPKPKIVGLEAIKSSTPSLCREGIKESLKIILNGTEDELIKYISKFKEAFCQAFFKEIAFPRGCNNLTEYQDDSSVFKKGTPMHVRGALVYNHFLKEKKLDNLYHSITNGDKIRYVYLKTPNPVVSNVISCLDTLPEELGLEKYIDYDLQFEKAFTDPLNMVLKVINWHTERISTLEGLFA